MSYEIMNNSVQSKNFSVEQTGSRSEAQRNKSFEQFFSGISSGLDSIKSLESQYRTELDRNFASRFNYFDYICPNELQLSKIIACLLDPRQTHGQGNLFFNQLVELLCSHKELQTAFQFDHSSMEDSTVSVTTEYTIPTTGRRIDIFIEIEIIADSQKFCIAIENKPYSGGQNNQIKDYLDYLINIYVDKFLLIYLSGDGGPPEDHSVDLIHLEAKDINIDRFAILPYVKSQQESDAYKNLRVKFSLVDWLAQCRRNCDAERLRSLLHDFEKFCLHEFGDQTVTKPNEKKFIRDFLMNHPSYLKYAMAVSDSWPDLQSEICRNFLKQLSVQIQSLFEETATLSRHKEKLEFSDVYKDSKGSKIGYFLKSHVSNGATNVSEEEYCWIGLASDRSGPDMWWLGVEISPESQNEVKEEMKRQLKSHFSNLRHWSNVDFYYWMNDLGKVNNKSVRDWSKLVPNLSIESNDESKKILEFYVREFEKFANEALPIILEIWSNYTRSNT